MRKTTRALVVLLASVNQPVRTAAIRAGALQASDLSSPQLALISPGISPSPKLLPLRSQFSCPLHRLLIRGCQALKLGSCSLGLPGKASKVGKQFAAFVCKARGIVEGVLQLVGELIRPGSCLATLLSLESPLG